jgi:hypothetical protein
VKLSVAFPALPLGAANAKPTSANMNVTDRISLFIIYLFSNKLSLNIYIMPEFPLRRCSVLNTKERSEFNRWR